MLSEEKLTVVMEETQKWGQSIQDKLDRLDRDWQERDRKNTERDLAAHRDHLNQQRRIVESKIDAPDYHHDHDIASKKRHQSAPGNWVLSHPLLIEWLEISAAVNKKIYLSGIPGAGKTVLTSRLISHLEQRRLNSKNSGEEFSMAYFYFKHMQPEKRSLISLLLSLLSQLTAQDESLLDHVYQSCCTTERQRLRSLDEVSHLISIALKSQLICFVIIDGLDECPEAPKVLEWFENLMSSRVGDPSGSSGSCIHLLISGQRDGVLEKQMAEYPSIQLETTMGHDQDIKAFTMTVAGEIREKFSLDPEVHQEIVSRVTSQARGMFLYAQLVVGNLLSQTSKYDLKQELKAETFPEGLRQAYERIIHRVLRNPKKAESDAARQILGMVMCACRPLHWREIQSKFCIDTSKGEADLDRQLLLTCKQLCGSLVEASYLEPSFSSPGEEVVDLVHSSAKAYLIENKVITMAVENAKMALFCAEFLLSRPLMPGISKLEVQQHATEGYYGFQDYAVAFWWKHAQNILSANGLETEMSQKALQAVYCAMIDIGELEQDEGPRDSPMSILALKSKIDRVSQDLRDWGCIKICEMRTAAIREAIGSLLHPPDNAGHTVLPLYGPWRYKCPKPWCQLFSSGFKELQYRQEHINQHDLPFLCDSQGCRAAEVGFGTETDLKRHTVRCHSKEEKLLFPIPKQRTSFRQKDIVKAAEKGDLDSIKYLVEQCNVNPSHGKKQTLRTPLYAAAEHGHLHVVQYLTQKGAAVDAKTSAARAPLHAATEQGHLNVVQYLTRMGADVNAPAYMFRQTALHGSVARRDLEITTFLCGLDRVALLKDVHNRTALDDAVLDDSFNKAIVAQLLRKAAPDVDALLSSGKANPNARNSNGALPFHVACELGDLPAVQRLHAVTTTNNFIDHKGRPLLRSAIANGYEDITSWILQKVANETDINASNKDGETLLTLALRKDWVAVIEILIKTGANLTDILGNLPLHWAIANGREDFVSKMLQNPMNEAHINASDKNGQTPLVLALMKGTCNEGAVKLLIENGANINSTPAKSLTPILLASEMGFEAVVKVLIEKGADVNLRGENGHTPLLLASWYGHEAVARLLVENGAAVNVSDDRGQTPLLVASRHGHEATASFLIDNGGADADGL